MRSAVYYSLSALVALAAASSDSSNPFNNPAGGYSFEAGTPTKLTWDANTSGTVSLKLQWGNGMDLESGDDIASDIQNSGSYTWTPSSDLADRDDYTIEIISDSDSSAVNYLPRFSVSGATGAASTSAASSTTSAASTSTASATSTSSMTTMTTTTSSKSSTSSTTSSSTSSGSSSSAASTSASATSSSASATSTSTSAPTSSASTSASASPTEVPNSNGGMINRVSGGMMALVLGAIALV